MSIKDFCRYVITFFKINLNMNKSKIKKYRVNPDDSMCLALSVVDQAAVESDFICLGKQEMEKFVATENKERRMIYGCALRSDFPIYRNSKEKGEYYLEFGKDAIDKISKDFFKNGFQSNWTEGHESEVEGLTITEAWIKESMTMDKSLALGLDPSIALGSWFIGCYCENDEIWNAVKEGKYHGFSCEALVNLEEFEKQMEIEPTNIELEAETTVTETPTITNETPSEASQEVSEPSNESEPINSPQEEQNAVTEPQNDNNENVTEPTVNDNNENVTEEAPKVDNHLEDLIASMREEIRALREMNEGLNERVKEMGKQPSAQPINVNAKPSASGINGSTYQSWRSQLESYLIG